METDRLHPEISCSEKMGKDTENVLDLANISFFSFPIKNVHPKKNVSCLQVYKFVISESYRTKTENLRRLQTKQERDNMKASDLDYVTFSGKFSKRANSGLIEHSNYFCVDLDHVGNEEELEYLKQAIASVIEPAMMFRSPSGDGLKVVVQIDITLASHEQYFLALQTFFKREFGKDIDEKCKDVSRACFLCYDPNCYYSDNPTLLDSDFIKSYQPQPTTIQPTTLQPNPIIDEQEIIGRLNVWINNRMTFSNGNRNKFVFDLCGAYNRYGIQEQTALSNLLQYAESGFTTNEIKAIVRSTYNNRSLHGIASFETPSSKQTKPVAKDSMKMETPLMPIDGLPDFLQHLIKECTRIYGTHRDLWTAAIIAATSSAMGQSVILKTKYENAALFWLCVVGPSGLGKSEPFDFAFKPIHDIDYKSIDEFKKQKRDYQALTGDSTCRPPEPCKQLIAVDVTPEKLMNMMSINPRGITIMREELQGWLNDFGRYSKSGEQQNMLSTWSQKLYKVSRKGDGDDSIPYPFINVFGGTHPKMLKEFAKDGREVNGFLPRFCFVYPSRIKVQEYTDEEISPALREVWEEYIHNLLSIPGFRQEIGLSAEATKVYSDYFNKNATLKNSGQLPDYMLEVTAKLDIIVLRLALLLHFANWACTSEQHLQIKPETMRHAIAIAEYFRLTARKVYDQIKSTRMDNKTLAKAMSDRGKSQTEIANVLDITQQAVSKFLK